MFIIYLLVCGWKCRKIHEIIIDSNLIFNELARRSPEQISNFRQNSCSKGGDNVMCCHSSIILVPAGSELNNSLMG